MARYLQFHINSGAVDGSRLLQESFAETMYTPPNTPAQHAYQDSSYALGITVNQRNAARHFQHGGGGMGFNNSMVWYPELKLGAVVLCNADLDNDLVVQLNEGILDSIIASSPGTYAQRAKSATQVEPINPPDDGYVLPDAELYHLIVSKALPEDDATEKRRNAFAGKYIIADGGELAEFTVLNGELNYFYQGYRNTLTELQPGLFLSPYGDTIDFRGGNPNFSNIPLIKIDPQTGRIYITFYVLCGLVFLSVFLIVPLRALKRTIRRKSDSADVTTVRPPRNSLRIWTELLAALASLFSVFYLILIAQTPNMVYFLAAMPFPRPYADLLWSQFAMLSLPYIGLICAVGIAVMAGLRLRDKQDGRAIYFYYGIVTFALVSFNLVILV
jgi:hypothetical protein